MKRLILVALLLVLFIPHGVTAQNLPDRVVHVAIGSALVAHGADIATSMYLRGSDPIHYREANPLLRPFQDTPIAFAVAKMGVAVAASAALLRIHHSHPRAAFWTACGTTALISYVAFRNNQLIQRR